MSQGWLVIGLLAQRLDQRVACRIMTCHMQNVAHSFVTVGPKKMVAVRYVFCDYSV